MGQAKTKVECPLCGGRSDTDDGCETASVNGEATPDKETPAPFNADKPLLTPLLAAAAAASDDGGGTTAGGRGGHASTASLPAYVGSGRLTAVAEEPSFGEGSSGVVENHTTTSQRHQLVVLRANRHHPPGHRVR